MMLRRVVERGAASAVCSAGAVTITVITAQDFDLQDTQSMPIGFEIFTQYAKKVNGL